MDDKILSIYCLCDDLLKALSHREDPQCQMSDAEIMTTAIIATYCFGGNYAQACRFLQLPQYFPDMLSKSQFNRRLHRLTDRFVQLFQCLSRTWKDLNTESIYVIDSYPIAVCDNYRIRRSRIYQNEQYRGYIPSKRRYFYGLRIHIMITQNGQPVEAFLMPGGVADVDALKVYEFDLPEHSTIYADKAYNEYKTEDLLEELCEITLSPLRKKNSKRAVPGYVAYLQHYYRKRVETAGSLIERTLPKSIHAVTAKGFELKVFLFVLAYSVSFF